MTTSGVPRAGGTARLGACSTSAADRHRWPPEPVPELVAPRRVGPAEVDVVGERWLSIRGSATRGERRELDADVGQGAEQAVDVPADAPGHGLEQLADVQCDPHATER